MPKLGRLATCERGVLNGSSASSTSSSISLDDGGEDATLDEADESSDSERPRDMRGWLARRVVVSDDTDDMADGEVACARCDLASWRDRADGAGEDLASD